jgi:putative inorganic carbon (HCO3(-)) transporter
MVAVRRRLHGAFTAESLLAAFAATLATLALAIFGERRLGLAGLLLPLALALAVILIRRPVAAVATAVALPIVCEGPTFGVPLMQRLYDDVFRGLAALDALVLLAILAVAADVLRTRRPLRLPAALALPLLFVLLASVAGVAVTRAGGDSAFDAILELRVIGYLLVLPVAVANLGLDRRQLGLALGAAVALAIAKAALGLIVMTAGGSVELDGGAHITYYEPTANWLVLVALLGVVAAVVGGMRPPRWMLLGTPLLIASLALSYRRSFWIAAVLGLVLLVLLGTTARGWRMIVPAAVLVAAAIWLLGSVEFQAQTPLVERVESLSPSQLERNAEDRYRLDERANVLAEIGRHPVTGIGLDAGWKATERSLPVEHVDGRQYVHFTLLWWWLKLGILGLAAFVAVVASGLLLAWRTWRRNATPLFRCFGLASLCATAGLVVVETTASFTGVDSRFTVVFAAQLGLLALLASPADDASARRGRP